MYMIILIHCQMVLDCNGSFTRNYELATVVSACENNTTASWDNNMTQTDL